MRVNATPCCDRTECLTKFLPIRTIDRAVHGSALDRTVYTGNVFERRNVRIIEVLSLLTRICFITYLSTQPLRQVLPVVGPFFPHSVAGCRAFRGDDLYDANIT